MLLIQVINAAMTSNKTIVMQIINDRKQPEDSSFLDWNFSSRSSVDESDGNVGIMILLKFSGFASYLKTCKLE